TKEIFRIRLGSLEPRIIDEGFIKFLTDEESLVSKKFCPNFCLSLQSGSDKILTSMNRHYTIADFKNACDLIRKYMKDATITTDVIVGFPGETDEDFEESLEFVKSMRFYNPNIFPYSIRKGTKAATFPNQLTNKVKHDRCVKMIYECEKISKEIESLYTGDVSYAPERLRSELVERMRRPSEATKYSWGAKCPWGASPYKIGDIINGILIEEIIEEDGKKYAVGYTKNYIKRKIQI
ncbi:MAG: radical SAM protein, partial [Lachnospiraceae bacterium]|nr:radical SAM protein [Lachnospiraceae bacterium]